MPLQSNLWFAAVDPASVPTPNAGYFALFISNGGQNTAAGFVHKKASNGDVSTAVNSPDDYTDEMARDAVAAILQDSPTMDFIYDDAGNFISANIPDYSLTSDKFFAGAVDTAALGDVAVTEAKLADGAVTAGKLGVAAVTSVKLDDGAVTTMKIADSAVSNAKLADGAVSNTKVDAGAITSSKLADNAVTNTKLGDAAVTNSKMAPLAVTTGNLADAAVTASKLATNSVNAATIVDGSVSNAELADGAVTAIKLAANAVTTTAITDANVTAAKLALNAVTTAAITDANVTAAKLALNAVTTTAITDANVTTAKLATDAVTNVKIADGAVNTAEIVDAAVTSAKLATDAVTNIKIADGAVNTAEILDAAVTTAKLATDAVTNVKIADGAVSTAEILDAAVTNAKLATMAAATFKMRASGAGTGAPVDGTAAQAKTALAITATDVSGLGTAATMASTAFDAAGAATTAQANAIAASQPLDSDLTAIAALSTTTYGRALLTLTDAAAHTAVLNAATASLKGLMSAADKSKLDSVSVISNKLRFTVTDNGILTTNTGAVNVTAWNALMSTIPDNSEVYFPPGPSAFPFASSLVIPAGKHLKIAGASNQKSIIQIQSATADIFQVNDWYNEFAGLKFTSSVVRTAGGAINSGNNVAVNVYDCDFAGMWDGIVYTGGVNAGNLAVIHNCGFTGTLNRGIVLDGTNANTIIDKVVMDGTAGVQQVGLELLKCGSVLVSSSDFIRSVNNLRFNPSGTDGVFSAYFTNTFFDTSPASSVKFQGTGNVQRVKFTNCWFSGSVTGCEFASTATTLPTAIDFVNCDIFGNSARGIYANGVQDFAVSTSRIAGNTTAGVEVNASTGSVTKFNLQNNAITATAGFGANGTGVIVNTGTYGGYVITGNDVRANTTANIADSGTVASTDLKIVGDNIGHLILGAIGGLSTTVVSGAIGVNTALLVARVPAKAVAVGQVFRVRVFGQSTSTGTLTFRVHAGAAGTTADTAAWTSITSAAQVANQRAGYEGLLTVRAIGATGSVQCECIGFAQTALLPTVVAAPATATVNTLTAWYITLAVASSLGTFTAQQAVVEAL